MEISARTCVNSSKCSHATGSSTHTQEVRFGESECNLANAAQPRPHVDSDKKLVADEIIKAFVNKIFAGGDEFPFGIVEVNEWFHA